LKAAIGTLPIFGTKKKEDQSDDEFIRLVKKFLLDVTENELPPQWYSEEFIRKALQHLHIAFISKSPEENFVDWLENSPIFQALQLPTLPSLLAITKND